MLDRYASTKIGRVKAEHASHETDAPCTPIDLRVHAQPHAPLQYVGSTAAVHNGDLFHAAV